MGIQDALGINISSPKALADALSRCGRYGDTMLAHITPKEAAILKARGGSGTINPRTGLPEFFDFDLGGVSVDSAIDQAGDTQSTNSDWSVPTAGTGGDSSSYSGSTNSYDWSVPTAGTGASGTEASGGNYQTGFELVNGMGGGSQAQSGASDWSVPTAGTGGASSSFDTAGVSIPAAINQASTMSDWSVPTAGTGAPQEQGFLDRLSSGASSVKEWADKNPGLVKALGIGGMGLIQNINANKASKSGSALASQYQQMANPYLKKGQELISAGQTGNLTAPQIQQLQALQQQAAQQAARSGMRGGTAALQTQALVQQQAQKFAQDLVNQGLQLVEVGNQYASKAAQASYAANQEAQKASSDFYTIIAKMLAGA